MGPKAFKNERRQAGHLTHWAAGMIGAWVGSCRIKATTTITQGSFKPRDATGRKGNIKLWHTGVDWFHRSSLYTNASLLRKRGPQSGICSTEKCKEALQNMDLCLMVWWLISAETWKEPCDAADDWRVAQKILSALIACHMHMFADSCWFYRLCLQVVSPILAGFTVIPIFFGLNPLISTDFPGEHNCKTPLGSWLCW